MLSSLSGQVAVVTGGARGIGATITELLCKAGCAVAIWDLAEEDAIKHTTQQRRDGTTAIAIGVDISSREQVGVALARTETELGAVSILVNNAGFSSDAPITEMTDEQWDSVMNVCLKGTFLCTQAVVPSMRQQQYGRIINIASRSALGGEPDKANYSAAKGGVVSFTRALAWELGPDGITVNAVAPGFTLTDRLQGLANYQQIKERAMPKQSVKRPGVTADPANAVLYLASAEAGFVNGEILHVTGGRYG